MISKNCLLVGKLLEAFKFVVSIDTDMQATRNAPVRHQLRLEAPIELRRFYDARNLLNRIVSKNTVTHFPRIALFQPPSRAFTSPINTHFPFLFAAPVTCLMLITRVGPIVLPSRRARARPLRRRPVTPFSRNTTCSIPPSFSPLHGRTSSSAADNENLMAVINDERETAPDNSWFNARERIKMLSGKCLWRLNFKNQHSLGLLRAWSSCLANVLDVSFEDLGHFS